MGVTILQMLLFLHRELFITGQETKSMLNNSGPRYKRSKIERKMNTDVLFCVLLLFFMCLIGALGTVRGTSPSIIQNALHAHYFNIQAPKWHFDSELQKKRGCVRSVSVLLISQQSTEIKNKVLLQPRTTLSLSFPSVRHEPKKDTSTDTQNSSLIHWSLMKAMIILAPLSLWFKFNDALLEYLLYWNTVLSKAMSLMNVNVSQAILSGWKLLPQCPHTSSLTWMAIILLQYWRDFTCSSQWSSYYRYTVCHTRHIKDI